MGRAGRIVSARVTSERAMVAAVHLDEVVPRLVDRGVAARVLAEGDAVLLARQVEAGGLVHLVIAVRLLVPVDEVVGHRDASSVDDARSAEPPGRAT